MADSYSQCHAIMTVREVAELLRLSEHTVRRMVRERKIKALRLGGAVRIQRSELARAVGINYSSNYSFDATGGKNSGKNDYNDFLEKAGIK